MASGAVKVEVEAESCCVCGTVGELLTPEEHDASSPPLRVPLRTMLLQLNNNKVLPEGRLCGTCAARAADAHEFGATLASRAPAPLSDKVRALRRRLHELTQHIDVFIVVGGPGAGAGAAYSEDDIIMVEKEALAAAAADEQLEHARNAKGEPVYQCTVCPQSFPRAAEYLEHCAAHPGDARHSCWTCGAQFAARDALREHAQQHAALHAATCYLCDTTCQSQAELRRHEATCAARCPACGATLPSRGALARHAAARHARGSPPLVCPACFRTFGAPGDAGGAGGAADALAAHLLRHRQARQFVCGYGACVLRFASRSNLMAHIRSAHAAELPPDAAAPADEDAPAPAPAATACADCGRSFRSAAALRRHARVHRAARASPPAQLLIVQGEPAEGMEWAAEGEGEVEYLEVETLELEEAGAE